MISTALSSSSLICSFASFSLLLIPSSIFFHFNYCILHLSLVVPYIFKYFQLLVLCIHSPSEFLDHLHGHYTEVFFRVDCLSPKDFPVAQMVKHLSTMWETWVQSLSREDTLEKEMSTHSSTCHSALFLGFIFFLHLKHIPPLPHLV